MPTERRIDFDGTAYTFEEMNKYYARQYNNAAIKTYWEHCKAAATPAHRSPTKPSKADAIPANRSAIRLGYNTIASDYNESRFFFQEVQNHATQQFIEAVLGGAKVGMLIDVACGKGGALLKYLPFMKKDGIVILADISEESMGEVQRRIKGKGVGTFLCKNIKWERKTADVFSRGFWEQILKDYGEESVDVVLCNFAFHYAFEDVQGAEAVLKLIADLLKPGGTFLGITADADAMSKAAASPASKLFTITSRPGAEFPPVPKVGNSYTFELPGHVPAVLEYMIPMPDLREKGEKAGLKPNTEHPIFWSNLASHVDFDVLHRKWIADPPANAIRTADELNDARELCQLYHTFMFQNAKGEPECEVRVAVYTGHFDPMHLNHVGLCQHLIKKEGFQHVYVVPNGESPKKPWAAPYDARKHMVKLALTDAGLLETCTVLDIACDDWKRQIELCGQLSRRHSGSKMFLVKGQDSYESSIGWERKANGRGIFSLPKSGVGIMVLKRRGCDAMVHIPASLARVVHVVSGYEDPIELSSTTVRQIVASSGDLTEVVSRSVAKYIQDNQFYQPRVNGKRIIVVLGAKSTPNYFCDYVPTDFTHYEHIAAGGARREELQKLRASIQSERRYIIEGLEFNDLGEFDKTVARIDAVVSILQQGGAASSVNADGNSEQYKILKSFVSAGGILVEESTVEQAVRKLSESGCIHKD